MSRFELYSPEGLRTDGRCFNELRNFRCTLGSQGRAVDGAAVVDMGVCRVMASVSGPQEPEGRASTNISQATLTVNLVVAPFASTERMKHLTSERPIQEIELNLQEAFSEAILLTAYPRTEIVVNLVVVAQDGQILPACVNAMTLALMDAGIPMLEYMSACSVAVFDNEVPLLDPNQIEVSDLPAITTAVLGEQQNLSLLMLERKLDADRMPMALELAVEGCNLVRKLMDEEVRRYGALRIASTV